TSSAGPPTSVFYHASNKALPTSVSPQMTMMAPLWGDWELRTTGDSTKMFIRAVNDTFYISVYNLAYKGTSGNIRATFQIVWSRLDSSVTYEYKSFDGSYQGMSAAQFIQNSVTIGLQDNLSVWGTTYLDRGTYNATSASSLYAQNLHNGLAVKFLRRMDNTVRIKSINTPPNDHYELTANNMSPSATAENLSNGAYYVYVTNTIKNLTTGVDVYSRTDSVFLTSGTSGSVTTATFIPNSCG